MDVLVAGAGIGGLSAAIALSADGHTVTVVEQSPRLDPAGAGIALAPNGVTTLARLGVDLEGRGCSLTRLDVRTAGGRLLSSLDAVALTSQVGPTVALTRPALHSALVEALPPVVDVVLGHEVEDFSADADGVTVVVAGTRRRVDLLVGADGVRSAVRDRLIAGRSGGAGRLRYTGTTCWRGLIDMAVGDCAVEAWGGAARIGVVPVAEGQTYYYLVLTAPQGAPAPIWPQGFRELFGGFRGAAGELFAVLEAMGVEPPLHHDLVELDRPMWGSGRVLLLGDAAHAMTPNLGQGAAMAIEDAAALTAALRDGLDGADVRYVRARQRRVRRVQLASRRFGTLAHWRSTAAGAVRDWLMISTPGGVRARAVRRLSAAPNRL